MRSRIIIGAIVLLALALFTYSVGEKEASNLEVNERYKVIHVNGRILFKKSGTDMKRGDFYIPGTLLEFKTTESRAAVIHKSKGRFVLSGNTKGKVKVLPAANNISSRGGALLNIVDLKKFFDGRRMFFNRSRVQIGAEAFPMSQQNFFYVTYQHNGEEIPKKLSYDGDLLFFDKAEIFMIDGKPIPYEEKEMTLYYFEGDSGKKINTFTPVFPDLNDLKEEVSVILEMTEGESVGKKRDEIAAHINEFHGTVQLIELNDWLSIEFDLE